MLLAATLANWTASNEQILVQMRRSLWEYAVVHLSVNILLFNLALQQLTVYPSVILIFLSVDQYLAHWLHPQSSASVLFAPASYRLFEAASVAESSSRNVMVEVVANSVA